MLICHICSFACQLLTWYTTLLSYVSYKSLIASIMKTLQLYNWYIQHSLLPLAGVVMFIRHACTQQIRHGRGRHMTLIESRWWWNTGHWVDTLGEAGGPLSVDADFSFLAGYTHQVLTESFCWTEQPCCCDSFLVNPADVLLGCTVIFVVYRDPLAWRRLNKGF